VEVCINTVEMRFVAVEDTPPTTVAPSTAEVIIKTSEILNNKAAVVLDDSQHEADNTMESEQLLVKMFVSRPANSCMDDSATAKISLGKSSYGVEYGVAYNVNYINNGQVTARRFMRELSRKARLVTPLSPSTGQRPVWPPPPRPDTLPPPPASPPTPTTPTVSPLIPTRSLARLRIFC
jgi:hypothetical protein